MAAQQPPGLFLRLQFWLRPELLHQMRRMRSYTRHITRPAHNGVHPWSRLHSHMAPWSLHWSLVEHEKQSNGNTHHVEVLWQLQHVNRLGCNIDGNKGCPCIGIAHGLGPLHTDWRRVKRDDRLRNPSQCGISQANTEIEHGKARSLLQTRHYGMKLALTPIGRVASDNDYSNCLVEVASRGCQSHVYIQVAY